MINIMKDNIKDNNNIHFFSDTTYKVVPYSNIKFKLLGIKIYNIQFYVVWN